MLILGHLGTTLGAAALAGGMAEKLRSGSSGGDAPARKTAPSWLSYAGARMDIRLLLVGALLPDIIDKPMGHFLFRETFSSGRIFSHTFLFAALVAIAGLLLYRKHRRTGALALAAGTFSHLVLDQMWRTPQTLWWPLLGLAFPEIETADWLRGLFLALTGDPSVYIPELLGLGILAWFGWELFRRGRVRAFLRHGQV